jgi:hypothetical protein
MPTANSSFFHSLILNNPDPKFCLQWYRGPVDIGSRIPQIPP